MHWIWFFIPQKLSNHSWHFSDKTKYENCSTGWIPLFDKNLVMPWRKFLYGINDSDIFIFSVLIGISYQLVISNSTNGKQDLGDDLSICVLNLQLVSTPLDTFSILVDCFSLPRKIFGKTKNWVFKAPVNVWLLAILKIQTQPQTYILRKIHNNYLYTACFGIHTVNVLIACLWS